MPNLTKVPRLPRITAEFTCRDCQPRLSRLLAEIVEVAGKLFEIAMNNRLPKLA